jgi:hypothetical protein
MAELREDNTRLEEKKVKGYKFNLHHLPSSYVLRKQNDRHNSSPRADRRVHREFHPTEGLGRFVEMNGKVTWVQIWVQGQKGESHRSFLEEFSCIAGVDSFVS